MKALRGKVVAGAATLSILGLTFVGSVGGFADSLDTPVRVQFEADDHISNPDPNPDELQLRFVPNLANFGSTHTAGNAITQSVRTTGQYVALYDGRDSSVTNNTWTLTASASNLVNPVETSQVINTGKINIAVGTMKDWNAPSVPTSTNTPTDAANITVGNSLVSGVAELTLDGTTVELAKTDTSISDHGYALPIESMTLELAASASNTTFAGQNFQGKITWALTDSF